MQYDILVTTDYKMIVNIERRKSYCCREKLIEPRLEGGGTELWWAGGLIRSDGCERTFNNSPAIQNGTRRVAEIY